MSDVAAPPSAGTQTAALPPVSFSTFLVSLGHTAMMNMDPKSSSRDLEIARQTVDLIGILQAKTDGNLDDEEKRLLDSMLGDLRERLAEAAS